MVGSCVIVGAGQAGAQAAHSLRQGGYEGALTLVGEEAHPPYQRPPLSKKYLAGEIEPDRVFLRPHEFYDANAITFLAGARVERLNRERATVSLASGAQIGYDALLLATGTRSRALSLPGFDKPGVVPLRTLADVDAMRPLLDRPRRLVIIGGGYIGLEVAAVARGLGHEVMVLEAQERVLARVVAPALSSFYQQLHTARGVAFKLGVSVAALEGEERVQAVRLGDGERIACDLVLVAVGAVANTELAADSGLRVDDGIVVDASCRTSDPAILAAGDCTRFHAARYGRAIRLESVQNAIDQAKAAAATILGKPGSYNPVPWFWSDQYDVKLQIAGLSQDHEEIHVIGDPAGGSFYIAYLRDDKLLAVDSVNHPRSHMTARRALGQPWRTDLLPAA